MLGKWPPAQKPLTTGLGRIGQPTAFQRVVQSPDEAGQYLVEIDAFRGSEIRLGASAMLGAGPTLGRRPLAKTPPSGSGAGSLISLFFGTGHWTGTPTDVDKPNTFYEGRVTVPLVFERSLPINPEQNPRIQRQVGAIEIANGDGALDTAVQSYAVDGRQVRILFGPTDGDYTDFGVIADTLGAGWETGDTSARLLLRDRGFALELPLQSNLYGGTGGADGTAEIEGKAIPLTFGRARNITPTLVDPTNLVFQFQDGAAQAVDDVFDRGISIPLDSGVGDVADYTALVAASITAGEHATALADGLFRLSSSPAGLITADVRGDALLSYPNKIDTVTLRILKTYAGLSDIRVNSASFMGLAAIGGELGIYISSDERPTTRDVLDALVGSAGGFWGAARDGRIRAGRLVKPEDMSPIYFFDDINVLRVEPEPNPTPRYRQRITFQRNWTEQRGEDLAAGVTDARRQFLTEVDRVAVSIDGSIRTRHPQALDPDPLLGLYELEADAQAIADNKLALHKPDRRLLHIVCKRLGYLFDLGSVVRLTWPRLGLEGGRDFVVVQIREDADRDETTLRLWG